MKLLLALFFACLALACPAAEAQPDLLGQVVKVSDGDTLTVLDAAKTQHKVRLVGIDAPEKAQAYGEKSREALAALVAGKAVRVKIEGKDKYGRSLGRVFVGDGAAAVDVNLAQVKAGFAWHYLQFAPKAAELAAAEQAARAAKAGLWADHDPTAPWDYRRQKKEKTT